MSGYKMARAMICTTAMTMIITMEMGCIEKRVMPSSPTKPMEFDLVFTQVLDFETPDIPDESVEWEMDLRLTVVETNRDDSLSFRLDFLDIQQKESDVWTVHPLSNQSVEVRCFPWGELLLVEGWDRVSVLEDVQWLDFVFGVVFPNPPVRSAQQWKSRLLPWPYFLNPEPHSKQIVSADWVQDERHQWTYSGTWYGKRGVTPLFDGAAKGSITATTAWVASHQFEWERQITKPISVKQTVIGKLEQGQ
jgi:hypothetical protein